MFDSTDAMVRVSPVSRLPPMDVPRRKPDLSTMSTNRVPCRKFVPAPGHGSGSPLSQRRVQICSSASSRIGAATSNHDVLMEPTTSDSGATESPMARGITMIWDCCQIPRKLFMGGLPLTDGQVLGSSRSDGIVMLVNCRRSRFAARVSSRP